MKPHPLSDVTVTPLMFLLQRSSHPGRRRSLFTWRASDAAELQAERVWLQLLLRTAV